VLPASQGLKYLPRIALRGAGFSLRVLERATMLRRKLIAFVQGRVALAFRRAIWVHTRARLKAGATNSLAPIRYGVETEKFKQLISQTQKCNRRKCEGLLR
jgi:hypothetical protein